MSRPARKSNPSLAACVIVHMSDKKLSARKFSRHLGVNVSTLTRSLKSGAFSIDLLEKLSKEIEGDFDDPIVSLRKSLHNLREAERIRSEVEATVRAALQRLEAAR